MHVHPNARARRRPRGARWLAGLTLSMLLVGCEDGPASSGGGDAAPPAPASTSVATAPVTQTGAADFTTAVQRVAAAVKPAVVQITTEEVQRNPLTQGSLAVPTGTGSGVFFDDQGHVLTNNHVIEGGSQIRVSLADGRTFAGSIVGRDPQTDLAVLKVDGPNLPKAILGESKQLQVGEWVVAIGHALGLSGGPTVTTGVVSALNRTVQEPGRDGARGPFLFGVIQTDASINPGNSGGPLVNLNGQVIGLNTLVAGQAGPGGMQAEGIGFAISIDTARRVAAEIVRSGRVVHAFLGIRYVTLTPAVAAQLGVRGASEGALIAEVVPNSPAARAGLQPQDVVTKIDGTALRGESALAEIVDGHKPGETVTLTVLRGGESSELRATLAESPS